MASHPGTGQGPRCVPVAPAAPQGHNLAPELLLNSHATVDFRKFFYAKAVTLGPRTFPRPPDFKTSCKNTSRKKLSFKGKVFYATVELLLSHKAQIHVLINSQVLNQVSWVWPEQG